MPHTPEIITNSIDALRIYSANILVSGLVSLGGVGPVMDKAVHFPPLPMPKPDKVCTPAPHFEGEGIEDEAAIFNQQYSPKLPRNKALLAARQELNATTLRLDVDYGRWENRSAHARHKYRANVVSTLKTAYELGYQGLVTLEQTPKFEPRLNRNVSYWRSNPEDMKTFAYSVASTLGPIVLLYSIENAPNNTEEFSKSGSMTQYDRNYLAGRSGVLAANPNAKVLAGELDPVGNILKWIRNLNTLPNDGIAIHSYQMLNSTHTFVMAAKTPLYITEYGDPAADPKQRLNLERATTTAKCDGAALIIDYQFIRDRKKVWNTGVVSAAQAARVLDTNTAR